MRKRLMSAAAVTLVFGLAIPASAAVEVKAVSNTSGDVSVTNVVDINANTSASGTVQSSSGAQGSSGTSGSVGSNTNTNTSTAAEAIVVTRADLDNNEVTVSTTNAASVNNVSEIRSYIAAELQNDTNLQSVGVADDTVEVTYKQKARLFAFIPVTVSATAIVGADGNVRVKYPWYSFLMSTDKAELESKIESRVGSLTEAMAELNAALDAEATANGNAASANVDAQMAARVSARAQAMLVAEVKAAMAEAFAAANGATDVQAEAEANANASGSARAE